MIDWPVVSLGTVLVKSRESTSLIPSNTYREVTVRMWGKGVVLRRLATGAEIAADRRAVVREGQFILSRIDARNGAFGIVPSELDAAVVSNDFPSFDPVPSRLDTGYLGWMSKTVSFVELCRMASEGTTNRVRLKEDLFLRMAIRLPPLDEQRRIVGRVDAVAAKVEEAQRLRREAAKAAAALTERFAISKRERLLSDWPSATIGEITRVSSGATPDRKDPRYWMDGNVPWVKTGELRDRDIVEAEEAITEAAVSETSAKTLPPGSVLVAMYGQGQTRGRTGLLRIAASTNQACAAIHPSDRHSSEYLQWWFRSLYTEMRTESRDGAQPNWNAGMVKNVRVALPPLELQRRTASELSSLHVEVDRLTAAQSTTSDELAALIPSILDRAFKGDL